MNTNGHREKNTSGGRRSFGWVVNASDLYEKHGVSNKVHDLIGGLALDGTLTELGQVAREADAAVGWDACHWRPNKQARQYAAQQNR